MDKRHWTAPVAKREAAWRLYVEHELKPRVQFYETKRHLNKASALKRALAIHRHQGWRLRVLFAEGRAASASRLQRSTTGANARPRTSKASRTDGTPPLSAAVDHR